MSNEQPQQDENQIIAERRAKLTALRSEGAVFPNDFRREHDAASLHAAYDNVEKADLEARAVKVLVAGRMMFKRVMGKASFASMQDASGADANGRIQLYVSDDDTGAAIHGAFKHYDLGDILGAEGTLFKTKT
ncbi:MAG: OB-fold nucleic acid binding domain-containing protein, partial [Burkholderiales bacterium]